MADDLVHLDDSEGVWTVTLDDPERRNAYSLAMKDDILDALATVEEAIDGVRCVVLQGAGDAFCAGGDVDRMEENLENPGTSTERMRDSLDRTNEIISTLRRLPVPVVSKIDGPAIGGGASLATAADLRIASEQAVIGFGFRNVGLSVDGGASYTLPRAVGVDRAKELALTGRTLDADEAAELGLVHRVHPTDEFEERAAEEVRGLATGPTEALGHIKRLLESGPEKSLERALEDELHAQTLAADTADHREGVRAFLEGRDPEFSGE